VLCVFVVRYLALVAALASEADWVLVPEWPPERGWEDVLCNKLSQVCHVYFASDSVLKHILIHVHIDFTWVFCIYAVLWCIEIDYLILSVVNGAIFLVVLSRCYFLCCSV